MTQPKVILVTGLSGAGKSTVLKALEDCGFEAIDNLPLSLLPLVLDKTDKNSGSLAIGIDIRNRDYNGEDFSTNLILCCSQFDIKPSILFLECENEILGRRYMETRRQHPLAKGHPINEGIEQERQLLASIKANAHHILDTSSLNGHDLRNWVKHHFTHENIMVSVSVISFSYKTGVPREADIVFDVRFLRNPYYLPHLQSLDGRNEDVSTYVKHDPKFQLFIDQFSTLLQSLLPAYEQSGKSYLTIAFGCTGGQHRSVVVAETIGAWLKKQNYPAQIFHREI